MAAVSSSSSSSLVLRRRVDPLEANSRLDFMRTLSSFSLVNQFEIIAIIASYFNRADYKNFSIANRRTSRMMASSLSLMHAERIRILCSSLYKGLRLIVDCKIYQMWEECFPVQEASKAEIGEGDLLYSSLCKKLHALRINEEKELFETSIWDRGCSTLSIETVRACSNAKDYSDIVRKFIRLQAQLCGNNLEKVFSFLGQLSPDELAYARSTEGFPVANLIDEEKFSEFMGYFPNLEEIKYLKSDENPGIDMQIEFPTIPNLSKIRALHLNVFLERQGSLSSLLRQTPNLTSLTLLGELNSLDFNGLRFPEKLEHFELSPTRGRDNNRALDDGMCFLFRESPNLQSLVLKNVNLDYALEGMPTNITTLRLKDGNYMKLETRCKLGKYLGRLLRLRTFEISCGITVENRSQLAMSTTLASLASDDISTLIISTYKDFYMDDPAWLISSFKKMKKLQYLYFVPIQGSDEEKDPNKLIYKKADFLAGLFSHRTSAFPELRCFNLLTESILQKLDHDERDRIQNSLPNIDDTYKHMLTKLNNPDPVVSDSDDVDMED